uniref:G_PROTEIN_RECEP_F1_2 domain-containing protein n=1 Tax=Caenorhabditis tropicalis TaxID=1561998 RepID=A0A1I7UKY1_9PELO
MTMVIACLIYQIESMIFCFVRKHQAIASTLKKYVLPSWLVWSLFGFFAFDILMVVGMYSQTCMDQKLQMDFVRKNFPEYLSGFESLPNFSIYDPDAFFVATVLFAVTCGIISFFILCLILANIFRIHVLSDYCYVLGTILSVSSPIGIGLVFSQAGMRREDQLEYVRENHPTYLESLLPLQNFAIYSSTNPLLSFVILITFFGGILCGLLFLIITIDMLKALKQCQTKVSLTSFQRYKSAVRSLLAQFSTSSLLLAPLFLFVCLVAMRLENSHKAGEILVAVMALHSPVNALVLVFTTPPFRNWVLR